MVTIDVTLELKVCKERLVALEALVWLPSLVDTFNVLFEVTFVEERHVAL